MARTLETIEAVTAVLTDCKMLIAIPENASRWCWSNGTWDNYSNYSMCRDVQLPTIELGVEIMTTLYFIGYSLSLFTLIMAVCIFIYYKWVQVLMTRNLKFFLFITFLLPSSKRIGLLNKQHFCDIFYNITLFFTKKYTGIFYIY